MAKRGAAGDGLTAFRERWLARRDELHRLHALADGAELCDTFLNELDAALRDSANELLSLQEAAIESGYSPDHLGRLIREGKLPNAGRPNAPKLRRGDLTCKPGHEPLLRTPAPFTLQSSKASIARAIATAKE